MIKAVGSSLSGISASFTLLNASSHNMANANTEGYKARSVSFREHPGGVSAAPSPGPRYALDGRVFEASNVSLASEMVSLITARHTLALNAAALRASLDMEGSLIDTLA